MAPVACTGSTSPKPPQRLHSPRLPFNSGKKFEEELTQEWTDSDFPQPMKVYVAFKHYGHLQRIMTVVSAKQKLKIGLYWFLIQVCFCVQAVHTVTHAQAILPHVAWVPVMALYGIPSCMS